MTGVVSTFKFWPLRGFIFGARNPSNELDFLVIHWDQKPIKIDVPSVFIPKSLGRYIQNMARRMLQAAEGPVRVLIELTALLRRIGVLNELAL